MNTKRFTQGLLFGASLLFASVAFAGEKGTVKLYENVKINGKTLAAGNYDLSWEGTGANVQVNIQKGKETVATFPAQLETVKSAAVSSGYATRKEDDGTKSLTSVFFAGKKYTINLDQQAAATSPQAASAPGNN